jgi:hypothetical protein
MNLFLTYSSEKKIYIGTVNAAYYFRGSKQPFASHSLSLVCQCLMKRAIISIDVCICVVMILLGLLGQYNAIQYVC